jgi:hypothetical protein
VKYADFDAWVEEHVMDLPVERMLRHENQGNLC